MATVRRILSNILLGYCVSGICLAGVGQVQAQQFTDVATLAGVNHPGNTAEVAWGDFDNDSDLDFYVSYNPGPNRLYRNEGNGTFSEVAADLGLNDGATSLGVNWGDYDNDGDLDLYVSNNSGAVNRLFKNGGNGTFSEVGAAAQVNANGEGQAAIWGDYDNDGWLDLYAVMSDRTSLLYHNEGDGTFADVSLASGVDIGGLDRRSVQSELSRFWWHRVNG